MEFDLTASLAILERTPHVFRSMPAGLWGVRILRCGRLLLRCGGSSTRTRG